MALTNVAGPADALRFGLIGPGAHATEHLLPALYAIPGVVLGAIAARDAGAARAAAGRWGARAWTADWTDLFAGDVVDAVVVAASPALHEEVIRCAIDTGTAVYVEKPPARDTAALTGLVAAQQAAGDRPVIFVGFNFPYGASYLKLTQGLAPHGPVRMMDVRLVSSKPVVPAWGAATVPESLLQGLGTHAVDMVLRTLGVPDRVSAHLATIAPERYALRVTLEYDDGRLATVHIGNHANRLEYRCELVTAGGVTGVLDQHNALVLAYPPKVTPPRLDAKETVRYDWPSRRGGYDRTGYSVALESFHRSVAGALPSTSSLASCLPVFHVLDEVLRQVGGRP